MLTHETTPELSLLQALGDLSRADYEFKFAPAVRQTILDLTLIQTLGQMLNEVEFAVKERDGPLYTFEMLDTTVFHGKLWSGTMLEYHEDVGNEVARLIENVATNYYCSTR